MNHRRRRTILVILLAVCFIGGAIYESRQPSTPAFVTKNSSSVAETGLALESLEKLEVKGRAPKSGYERSIFGEGWAETEGCDTRNLILQRDLTSISLSEDGCTVMSGKLKDPYTGFDLEFARGEKTSSLVQIDHVVPLSDAWQKGAQAMSSGSREKFANDGLNLLAVDGPANRNKGDGDVATWLPPNKSYRCQYVARIIAVKQKYDIWVTAAERDSMKRILKTCPTQQLPKENS